MIDRELGPSDFVRAIPRRVRERLMAGRIEGGGGIVALRRFVGLTQATFSSALGISVHTLRNWEQGRRRPALPMRANPGACQARGMPATGQRRHLAEATAPDPAQRTAPALGRP